jgi:hypothetical protein
MAKQAGHTPIRGTINNLTYYNSKGQELVRTKSSLTRERVKKDPAFARSRESSKRFALGQSIASAIYKKLLPKGGKQEVFAKMRSEAILLVKAEVAEKEIAKRLTKKFKPKLIKKVGK